MLPSAAAGPGDDGERSGRRSGDGGGTEEGRERAAGAAERDRTVVSERPSVGRRRGSVVEGEGAGSKRNHPIWPRLTYYNTHIIIGVNMQIPLKNARIQLGLTQVELAMLSDVSLPTIQNLDAGKGNPSWTTIQALADRVGFEVKIEPKRANWDELARCGAPLKAVTTQGGAVTAAQMTKNLREAVVELTFYAEIQDRERKLEAIQALLFGYSAALSQFF